MFYVIFSSIFALNNFILGNFQYQLQQLRYYLNFYNHNLRFHVSSMCIHLLNQLNRTTLIVWKHRKAS